MDLEREGIDIAAGATAPKSQVLQITKDDGTALEWTVTVVTADGKTDQKSWSGAYDGKLRPVEAATVSASVSHPTAKAAPPSPGR